MLLARTLAAALCCLAFAATPGAALGPEATGVLASLQYFDQEVQQGLRALAAAAESPNVEVPPELADEAAALLDGVRDLEVGAQALPEADRDFVLAKVRSVRWQAEELVRLATQPAARDAGAEVPSGPLWPYPNQVQAPADHCEDAPVIGLGSFTGTTEGADGGGAEASCGASYDAPDVWYRFVAPEPIRRGYYFSTIGSGFDTVLSIYRGCPGLLTNQVTCNDDSYGLQSAATLWADPGEEFLVRISGAVGASGAYQLNVTTGATLTGSVIDESTGGAPVEPVSIRLYGWAAFATETDAGGRFTFAGLPPYRFHLRAGDECDPYLDEIFEDVSCVGPVGSSTCSTFGATPLQLLPLDNPPVTIRLSPGGTLGGRLLDPATDDDLAGWIEIFDRSGSRLHAFSTSGEWSWNEAPARDVYIAGSAQGRQRTLFGGVACPVDCDPTSGTPVHVEPGATVAGLDIPLLPLGSVRGLVFGSTGEPAVGARVTLRRADGAEVASSTTAANGSYELAAYDGSYLVHAQGSCLLPELHPDIPCAASAYEPYLTCDPSEATIVDLRGGMPPTTLDFTLSARRTITGTVRDRSTSAPIPGATVQTSPLWRTTTTDAAGRYSLACLEATYPAYRVLVPFAPGHVGVVYPDVPCPERDCDIGDGTPVTPTDGSTTGIDFWLGTGGAIEGRVIAADTLAAVPGQTVRIAGATGNVRAMVITDATGRFRAEHLAPQPHYAATDRDQGFMTELFHDILCPDADEWCSFLQGTQIAIAEGGTTLGVDFTLERMAGISGTVTTRDGQPTRALVTVFNSAGTEIASDTSSSSDGSWSIGGLAAGTYYAAAGPLWSDPLASQTYDGQDCTLPGETGCSPLRGTPIVLADREARTDIDFILGRHGVLQGSVTGGWTSSHVVILSVNGAEIASASPWSTPTPDVMTWGRTVAPGRYLVWLEPSNAYHGQAWAGVQCEDVGCAVANGLAVDIGLDETVDGIDFTLEERLLGTLEGVVADAATGSPLEGALVVLKTLEGAVQPTVFSDPDGIWTANLRPGQYRVQAKTSGYFGRIFGGPDCWSTYCPNDVGTVITVEGGATTRHVDLLLQPKLEITGQVAAPDLVNPAFDVTAYDQAGAVVASVFASSGEYTLAPLPPGAYTVTAAYRGHGSQSARREVYSAKPCPAGPCTTIGTPVVLSSGESATGIDFSLEATPAVRGTVRSFDGSALVGATITAYDGSGTSAATARVYADSGIYILYLPAAGTYFLKATHSEHIGEIYPDLPAAGTPVTDGEPLTLDWGEALDGIDFSLDRLPVVAGEVRSETGEPLPQSSTVYLLDPDGNVASSRITSSTFQFGVEPGSYYLAVRAPAGFESVLFPGAVCAGTAPSGCDVALGQPITIDLNQAVTGLVIELPDRRGWLVANVVDAMTGAGLEARATLGSSHYVTNDHGELRVRLIEGTYDLTLSADGYITELYEDIICHTSCNPDLGTPIQVERGSTTDLGVIDLAPGFIGFIGEVTSASDRQPLPRVFVDAWNAVTWEHVASTATAGDGFYRLTLPPGTYLLSTDAGEGWIDQVHAGIACPDGPAFQGACDLAGGTVLTAAEIFPTQVDFVLTPHGIFADGFEDGTLGAWTASP